MENQQMKQPNTEPAIELEITLPIGPPSAGVSGIGAGESLSLVTSIAADAPGGCDASWDGMLLGVVDILGSAVAESTGWIPPEEEAES